MTGWRLYDPWPGPMRDMLEQLMTEQHQRTGAPFPMPLNVYEDGDSLVVEAAMPGVKPDEVELSCRTTC